MNGRWSDAWIEWPKLQKFWSDLIDSMRSGENDQKEQTRFDLVQYVEQGSLHLDLTVYSDVSGGRVQAEVVLPDSTKSNIDFESVVKGRYHALVRDPKPGKYELHGKVGNSSLTPVAFHLSGELFGERKGQGFNLPLLSQLADISGGKLNPSPSEVKGQEYKQIEQSDLSIYFILSALILVLLEILMREAGLFARLFRRRQPAKVSAVV